LLIAINIKNVTPPRCLVLQDADKA